MARRALFGNPKSSLKPRASVGREMRVTVDQAREQRLAASVVDLGLRIRPEDRSVGPIAAIVSPSTASATSFWTASTVTTVVCEKTTVRARRRLSLEPPALLEEERRGARAGSGEQLAPAEVVSR